MNESTAVAAVFVATVGLLAFKPNDELAFLLQFFGTGLALGMLVAYRAAMRNPGRDTFAIQARWGGFFLAIALLAMLVEGVLL